MKKAYAFFMFASLHCHLIIGGWHENYIRDFLAVESVIVDRIGVFSSVPSMD
jgi:hypothetical protein